jgi:hypothetical protein
MAEMEFWARHCQPIKNLLYSATSNYLKARLLELTEFECLDESNFAGRVPTLDALHELLTDGEL